MEFFDILAQIISQTFLDEQYKQARWREALRYQLHSIIFYYPEDTEGFVKTAAALRLDGTIPRIALAIDVRSIDSHSPTFKSELDRIVVATARRLKLPVDALFDIWYCGKLLVWIPARLGDLMGMSDLQVGKQIVSIAETIPEIKAIGIGLTGEGAAGWAMSAEEASRALSVGALGRRRARAVVFENRPRRKRTRYEKRAALSRLSSRTTRERTGVARNTQDLLRSATTKKGHRERSWHSSEYA
jgi:sugar diacid utilization regulator